MAQGSGKTPNCSQRGQQPAVSWEESLVNASFGELLSADRRGRAELLQARLLCILKTECRRFGETALAPRSPPKEADVHKGVLT